MHFDLGMWVVADEVALFEEYLRFDDDMRSIFWPLLPVALLRLAV